ncbi:serine hydrolase domain-containing protein [Roseomonas marmotae]|uniref:Serine hydrolase n=1 Tax=Roseomonas marmotae TaxID=2768161 RepID=A0ABS3KI35_9PROT|nr:serine hydrolase [Roseomonas marmotae]MBO1077138.1 serine hydrolase [Roseomonas marmotae]QTI82132.1 serine hydrolase [Roseomonas marmotae]
MSMSYRGPLWASLCLASLFLGPAAGSAWGQAPDPALIEARRQRSNPSVALLMYRHLDELLNTRPVAPGEGSWRLERSNLALPDDAPVTIGGKTTTFASALQELRVNAVLVLRDGRLVREVHRNGGTEESRYIGFSMSKSWMSVLIGIAIQQGHIGGVDDRVVKYLPELAGSGYDNVTLRDLLTMRAGTSWVEDYSPGTELDRVRDASANTETAYYEDIAGSLRAVEPPGSRFNYSTLDTELAGVILARATGRSVAEYMSEVLWKPAGMEAPGYWLMQGPTGRQHEWYGVGFGARLRDYARLGQMMLDGGVANGKQIVSKDWVEASTRSEDGRYFYFWWGIPGVDGFSANGIGGQRVFVDRATRTVMVLASYAAVTGEARGADLFKSVISALR